MGPREHISPEPQPPDEEFQKRGAGWSHFLRIVEIIRRTDAGERLLQLIS